MPIQPAPTVRESLEAAVETVAPEAPVETVETPQVEAVSTPASTPASTLETEEQKAERLRNKDGTFAKGKIEEKPKAEAQVTAPAVPVAPTPQKLPMPASWKKELAPEWDAMTPKAQAYALEREKQYQTGVSTYKSEADRAKSITTALAQFEPLLQKKGIKTDHWIQQMGVAHYLISEGSPQERVQAVAQIIRNNGIDVNALGQFLAGQQPTYQQPQVQQQVQQPIDVKAKVAEALQEREVEQAFSAFTADVVAGKYPHFADEEVKGTMAGLLSSGLAQDYPSAYETALAMPKHRHLVAPAQPAAPVVPNPVEQKQAQAQRARSQAVSVKSSTPSAMAQTQGPKSLRDQLSEQFDKATASRV